MGPSPLLTYCVREGTMEGKEGYSVVVGLMSDECTGYLIHVARGAGERSGL